MEDKKRERVLAEAARENALYEIRIAADIARAMKINDMKEVARLINSREYNRALMEFHYPELFAGMEDSKWN